MVKNPLLRNPNEKLEKKACLKPEPKGDIEAGQSTKDEIENPSLFAR